MSKWIGLPVAMLICTMFLLPGCATGPEPGQPAGLKDAVHPAWSLKGTDDEIAIDVSPARQTLQIAGSSGVIIGAGISAVVNDRYRRIMRDALEGYEPADIFRDRLETRLAQAVPMPLTSVPPLTSTAGFDSKRQAEQARCQALAKQGADVLLDLDMTFGLFGPAGTLVTKLDGRLAALPSGHALWDDAIVVYDDPILADQKPTDPTNTLGPNFSSLRFSVEDDAVERWARDGGKPFRTSFEASVDAVVSALLCDLGLADDAVGNYYLAKMALGRKKFEEADAYFRKALALDPNMYDAENGRSVNLAHSGQLDDAIAAARRLTETAPEYAPAWFNLAWWLATEKNDPAAAKPCYDKALSLGLPPNKKIEKVLETPN